MQKWEYFAIGPIKDATSFGPVGHYPVAAQFNAEGQQLTDLKGGGKVEEGHRIAAQIAQLGKDGWEMVGCGTSGSEHQIVHYLYFKRPLS